MQRGRPGLGRFPGRRAWQPTPVFLPGESPWTEEPAGLQSRGSQRVGHSWATKRTHARTHTHTQRANTSHQWVIVQIGLLTCVTVMLTYYRRGIRASKLTRFASIQQSVKIFIWGAPLSHLELDHKMKQGNHRKDGTEGHLNSCWESPSKCSDGSQSVKEKKTRTSHWWLGS